MKRDLYAEVSTRIVAELERGAAPWIIVPVTGPDVRRISEEHLESISSSSDDIEQAYYFIAGR